MQLAGVAALAFDGRNVSYSDFLEVLKQQAEHTIFAPESRDAAVQIIGPMETAGLSFDAMWFLGATDASWLLSPNTITLIPSRSAYSRTHAKSRVSAIPPS